MSDSWITSNTDSWTTRDGDQWLGDLTWQMPEALSVSSEVLPAIASHTTVVSVSTLEMSTQLKASTVSLLTEVSVESLSVSTELLDAGMFIDTQIDAPVVDELELFVLPAEGIRAEIVFAPLMQATFTPKNPIVESDVYLSPDTLGIDFSMEDGLYGSLAYIETDLIGTLSVDLKNANAYADISLFPTPITMTTSLYEVVVDFDHTVFAPNIPVSIDLQNHYISNVPVFSVDIIEMEAEFLTPEVFAGVVVNPVTLTISTTLNASNIYNDYSQDAQTVSSEIIIPEHTAISEPDINVATLELSSSILEPANIQFAPLFTITSSINNHTIGNDYQIDADALSMGTTINSVEYSFDSQQSVPVLNMSVDVIEIEYASETVREWEIFSTPVTKEIDLSTKVDIRGRFNE